MTMSYRLVSPRLSSVLPKVPLSKLEKRLFANASSASTVSLGNAYVPKDWITSYCEDWANPPANPDALVDNLVTKGLLKTQQSENGLLYGMPAHLKKIGLRMLRVLPEESY
jgi:hypothetical protein